MKHPYSNGKQKNPIALWKYAGIRNAPTRHTLLAYLRERGYFVGADMTKDYTKFYDLVEESAKKEDEKFAARKKLWNEDPKNFEQIQANKKRQAARQRDNNYGPSEGSQRN